MSKPDRVTSALTKLLDNSDPALVATAAGKLADLRIAKLGNEKSENKVGPLRDEIAELKKSLTAAPASLGAVTAEKDSLTLLVTELQPLADRLPIVETELSELKSSVAADRDAMRKELLFTAEAKLREAKNFEERARIKFTTDALSYSVREWQAMAAQSSMPDFWSEDARNHSALFWAAWMPEEQAVVWCGLAKSYGPENPGSRAFIVRVLETTIPQYSADSSVVTSNHQVSFVTALAQKMGILSEVTEEIETLKARKFNEYQMKMNVVREQQQIEMTRLGYGRSPIGQGAESESSTVPLSEHVLGCCCVSCGGTGIPDHLRTDTSLGTAKVVRSEDINEPSPMSVAARAMEREERVKKEAE